MRFSENNDCVFYAIFNAIKNLNGYKRYTIDKIKSEFKNIGIKISNGVNGEEVEKWITSYDHRCNFYLYGPDLRLKYHYKGNNPHKQKMANVIMVYNNNHCYPISENIIKNITSGKQDINDIVNPLSNIKFDKFEDYELLNLGELLNILYDDTMTQERIGKMVLVESENSFVNIIHQLLKIDNSEINYIDYKMECILFRGIIIMSVKDYYKRKNLCAFLKKKLNLLNFNFCNQSYSKIGMDLFKIENNLDYLEKSYYNQDVLNLIDNYYPEPLHYGVEKSENKISVMDFFTKSTAEIKQMARKYHKKIGGDYSKSYALGIMKFFVDAKIPVLTIFDDFIIKEFKINSIEGLNLGCYLIKKFSYKKVVVDTCLMPLFMVEKFISKGIELECLGYVESRKYIDGNMFVSFVKKVFEIFDDLNIVKRVINSFTGLLNKKWLSENRGFITQCDKTANISLMEGYDLTFEGEDDNRIYIAKCKNTERMNGDHCIIYHSIILGGILNVFDIVDNIDEMTSGKFEITGINTDAVYFKCNENCELQVDNTNLESIMKQPIKMNCDEYRNKIYKHRDERNIYFEKKEWKNSNNGSYFHNGIGGESKTWTAINTNKDRTILCLAFENSAVDNMRNYCIKFDAVDYKTMTIHSALGLNIDGINDKKKIDFSKFEVIIVDEFFRIDPNLQTKLYEVLIKVDCRKIILGSIYQNKYIGDETYKYNECDFLGELVDFNRVEFSEEEMIGKIERGHCRYDLKTFKLIKYFIKHKRMPEWHKFKKINKLLNTNICFKNETRKQINNLFSAGLKVGDKAILNEHYEKDGFFKGYEFEVEKFNDGLVNGIFKVKDVDLGYCITSHRKQGKTERNEYNIYDTEIMTFENLLTAITRTNNIDNIHLNKLKKYYKSEYDRPINIKKCFKESVIGYIYFIECKITGYIYVGMTLRNMDERFKEHRTDPDCIVSRMMIEPEIYLIGEVKGSERLVMDYEKEYTIEYKKTYGENLINLTNYKEKINDVKGSLCVNMNIEIVPNVHEYKDRFRIKYKNAKTGKMEHENFRFSKLGKDETFKKVMNIINEKFNGKFKLVNNINE